MKSRFADLPRTEIHIAAGEGAGPFEWRRHSVGHGGINSHPLPERVIRGARQLGPRLIRTFLQEYLRIYPDRAVFDWGRCDPYLESLAATGANVMAAITLKPGPLFPTIDHTIWQPADTTEWQQVITALVRRYSVERPIVTHWEVGNETDIGEWGGSPFLVKTSDAYFDYYLTMVEAILLTFPDAKVGGPALAGAKHDLLPGFLDRCAQTETPLDFISWHCYDDDPEQHARLAEYVRGLLADWPGARPELMVTEWNKSFDPVSVEEMAFDPARAAHTAATILAMMDAKIDASFYYHLWDQTAYIDEFSPFFADPSIMAVHWNEVPHRFGLFGVKGEVRPQYFVYWMLSRMGDERLSIDGDPAPLRACAARGDARIATLLINYGHDAIDRIADLHFDGIPPGRKQLIIYRIDDGRHWSEETLDLHPVEQREVDTGTHFHCQVFSPTGSVTLAALREEGAGRGARGTGN